ncbi:hypothetical protein CVIRNUC_003775 [Coccomyxa viridis]|uniref:Enoyl reductase (ER) domain-containing protein n=1 Tax=Coccomyxa viridis TaxID=1274662 RepID=A0AAV1I2K4_9CHLO|nr:hypothetical protein CVIRNUC_003775 [Coccomyxa viridis]
MLATFTRRALHGQNCKLASSFMARCYAAQPAVQEQAGLENPAAVLYSANDLRYEHHHIPTDIPPGHVRVQMRAVGICGSDVHFYKKGRIADFVVEQPMVIGHESAGDVVGMGEGVSRLQMGARVALEPGIPCWGSKVARKGRYNLCPDVKFFATPPVHGSLARYVDHPEDFCFELPGELSYEEGAMIEPLSNGIHACRRAGVEPGKTVAILGAGPMGLNALVAAQAFGATKIVITDVREDNLPLAERLGAKFPLLTPPSMKIEEAADLITKLLPPDGPDCVIDCAGYQSTILTGMQALARGGTFVLVGMGSEACNCFPSMTLVSKEADVKGCFRYTNTYPMAIEMLQEGKIDVKPMITHRFGFTGRDEVIAGFECAANAARTKSIKVMFNLPAEA